MENEEKVEAEVVGYCAYCKDEIIDTDAYVVDNFKTYHVSCYILLTENTYTD